MINAKKTNIIYMGRNELLEIAKQELESYKAERQYNQVHQNIPRLKNLEVINKRLGAFSFGDSEVLKLRSEIKDLLNEDVYKKTEPPKAITHFSSYEDYINARLRSK